MNKTTIVFTFNIDYGGRYRASVKEDNIELPGSPFYLDITKESTSVVAISCVAYGPSLKEAIVNQDNYFYVNLLDSGEAKFEFLIVGPAQVDVISQELKDNLYTINWKPRQEGLYSIQVKYDGIQIPGSPFWVKAFKKPIEKVIKK